MHVRAIICAGIKLTHEGNLGRLWHCCWADTLSFVNHTASYASSPCHSRHMQSEPMGA